jgi:UDP-3-O-[3-hydroxymyristoyl] glucosamine N-acyltransferase LpxD
MGDYLEKNEKHSIMASDISEFLGAEIYGDDIEIRNVKSLDQVTNYSLTFSKNKVGDVFFKQNSNIAIIMSYLPENIFSNSVIVVKNPRLAFAKVLTHFFSAKKNAGISEYTFIHPSAKIDDSVTVGNGCSIGRDVIIGEHTEIFNNVVLGDGVKIGRNCLIKSNTVIGEKGFGFAFEEDDTPFQIAQLGSVEIADFVEIGALNTVCSGTLSNTIIHEYVKTDDHVHIAHNCIIGAKTIITACAEISGSVIIGEKSWLGPNCAIMNKIKIGEWNYIGLGAVVLKDTPDCAIMVGNPAKVLRYQERRR